MRLVGTLDEVKSPLDAQAPARASPRIEHGTQTTLEAGMRIPRAHLLAPPATEELDRGFDLGDVEIGYRVHRLFLTDEPITTSGPATGAI
jgi:hypothetical protein